MDVDNDDPQQAAALERLQRSKKIANIVEAYFSDSSLLWDKLLLSKIEGDSGGFVEIAWLSKQSRLKPLKCTPQEIVAAVTTYSFPKLKLDEDHTHIARQKPYVKQKVEELDDWSIYVEGLQSPYNNQASIANLFAPVGKVCYLRIPDNKNGQNRFYGFCFVEFEDKAAVQRAVDWFDRFGGPANKKEQNTASIVSNEQLPGSSTKEQAGAAVLTEKQKNMVDQLRLRVMTKRAWLALKEEYLANQERCRVAAVAKMEKRWMQEQVTYPLGVIALAKNVNTASNKTILKEFFQEAGFDIAYVEYTKGLDTCYVRFNTSETATTAVEHFATEKIVHRAHTDHTGAALRETGKSLQPVQLRILTDQEEAVYWERVESGRGQQAIKNKGRKAPVHESPWEPKSANSENTTTIDRNLVMGDNSGTKPKRTHIRFAGEEDDEDERSSVKRAAGDEPDEKGPSKHIRFEDSD